MSGALRTIGKVAGVVASVAALIPGPHQPFAAAAAFAINAGMQITAKPPVAKGQVNERVFGANNPQPYLVGRSYSGGLEVHDVGYGGTVSKVENPYRFIATVASCCGPVEGLESVQVSFQPVSFSGTAALGYYADWMWRDFKLGARPEAGALTPQFSGAPRWGTAYKLSGFAQASFSLKWSKDGKRFAGGTVPPLGCIWKGVKTYDARLDSTYPGGSGAHRIDDESTWTYTRRPAWHAVAYAYGRYVNGEKVFGVDLGDVESIDMASAVAWANLCDDNDWNVDGVIYEPGDKWNNLKRICEAGGATPVVVGGVLRFDFQAPRASLYTVTRDDLADGPISASLGKGWKNRINTLQPRFRSEAHQWTYQQAAAVSEPDWVIEDGEAKVAERQWDLVTGVNQVTELAIYDLWQRREAGPIRLPFKPHMRVFEPGDCLTLAAELGVHPAGAIKIIIRENDFDPVSGTVIFEMEQETDAKHVAAVGATGTAPTETFFTTGEAFDQAFFANNNQLGTSVIRSAAVLNARTSDDVPRALVTSLIADFGGGDEVRVNVAKHDWDYPGSSAVITRNATTARFPDFSAIPQGAELYVYFDDATLAASSVTYLLTEDLEEALNSVDYPGRHAIAKITTPSLTGVTNEASWSFGYGSIF